MSDLSPTPPAAAARSHDLDAARDRVWAAFADVMDHRSPVHASVADDALNDYAAALLAHAPGGREAAERTDWTNTACPFCPRCGYPDPLDSPRNGSPLALSTPGTEAGGATREQIVEACVAVCESRSKSLRKQSRENDGNGLSAAIEAGKCASAIRAGWQRHLPAPDGGAPRGEETPKGCLACGALDWHNCPAERNLMVLPATNPADDGARGDVDALRAALDTHVDSMIAAARVNGAAVVDWIGYDIKLDALLAARPAAAPVAPATNIVGPDGDYTPVRTTSPTTGQVTEILTRGDAFFMPMPGMDPRPAAAGREDAERLRFLASDREFLRYLYDVLTGNMSDPLVVIRRVIDAEIRAQGSTPAAR